MKKDSLIHMSLTMFCRLFGYHLLALLAVLGVMVFLPGQMGAVVAQVFGFGIITLLPFMPAYQVGGRDSNKIRYGSAPYDRLKGLKAGFIAYSPFILASVFMIIAKLGIISDGYLPFYRLINAPFMPLMQALMPTALTLNEISTVNVILCALTSVVAPISIALGYWQGANRISLSEEFASKKAE